MTITNSTSAILKGFNGLICTFEPKGWRSEMSVNEQICSIKFCFLIPFEYL